jgi:hypothetical protein
LTPLPRNLMTRGEEDDYEEYDYKEYDYEEMKIC